MAQIIINTGTSPNDGTGDDLRTSFTTVNTNFTELYATGVTTSNLNLSGNSVISSNVDGDIILDPNGTGNITLSADVNAGIIIATTLQTTGDATITGIINQSYTGAIAAAGSIQGTATLLTTNVNMVSTATATSADGIRLPAASSTTSTAITIHNNSGVTLAIWPFLGDTIEGNALNAEDSNAMVTGTNRTYKNAGNTFWFQVT